MRIQSTRVAVIGDGAIREVKLCSIARRRGRDPGMFELVLGYSELKHCDLGKLRVACAYRVIIAGPMLCDTHGTSGIRRVRLDELKRVLRRIRPPSGCETRTD